MLLLLLLLPVLNAAAGAAEVHSVDIRRHGDRYFVKFDAVVNAPVDQALRLMLTPVLWPQLSPIITDAKVLERDETGPRRVAITFYDCVFIFCKTVHKTEDITIGKGGHIESLAIPGESDFSYAHEDWHIYAEDGRTRIQYQAEMVPSFFVPPLIGPIILKARMRSQLNDTAANLENLSPRKASPPGQTQ